MKPVLCKSIPCGPNVKVPLISVRHTFCRSDVKTYDVLVRPSEYCADTNQITPTTFPDIKLK